MRQVNWAAVTAALSNKGVIIGIAPGAPIPDQYDIAVVNSATGGYEILLRSVFAQYAATGHLVFVRVDGSVLAAPFDQDRLVLTGPPVPLFDGVRLKVQGMLLRSAGCPRGNLPVPP